MSNQMIRGGRWSRNDMREAKRALPTARMPRRQIIKRLWRYLGRNRALMVLAIFLTLLSSSIGLVGPRLSGLAIDAIGLTEGQADFPKVFLYVGLMAASYVVAASLGYILSRVTLRMTRNIIYRMRKDVFDKLVSLPVNFFDKYQAGEIISVVSYDVDTVNESLSTDFLQILQSLVTVTVSFVMMMSIKPILTLVFLVTIPLTALYTRWITGRTRPLFRKRSQKLGELNGYMEEMMGSKRPTRAYGREKQVIEGFDEKNEEAVVAYTTAEYYGTMIGPSVGFINNISLTLISVFGALLFLRGQVGLGSISSFVQYSRRFSGPINELASIFGELQSAFAAAERVFRLIDAEPEAQDAPDATVLMDVSGDVRAEHVDFSYIEGVPVIRDFSMHAKPGALIAIAGPTGAGKTTLVNLLMRFYDIDAGSIKVDGQDIYGLTRSSLRGAYTMVLQDSWLFYGSVYDNIAYACEDATPERVEAAARAAMIHSFIKKLPRGYDTIIGDDGVNISKGQKQLITIARAMLSDARMLILDEATSNVDTQTEQRIQQAMRQLMAGRTAFVIAHRLSTIKSADTILVVRDGNIVEQGKHEDLMAQQGYYASLYYAQYESY